MQSWRLSRSTGVLLWVVAWLAVVDQSAGENWPAWRGPRGDGSTRAATPPVRWSATENVAWKTALPGSGHSSPVIWGDRVFVTACDEGMRQRLLLCIDANSGAVVWKRVAVEAPLEEKHKLNSFASSTPATDGHRVWVTFQAKNTMQVVCFDFTGHTLWHTSPGEFHSKHGFCSPPIVYKDTIILNGDQDAEAWLVALDGATGKELWRADRPNRTRSYCPPLIIEAAGKTQLVLSGSKCVASYDPDTGKQYWLIDGPTEQFVASPVFAAGVVFITGGYPTYHLMGIRPDGAGNVSGTHVLYHHKKQASYVPSPIAQGEYFYVVTDQGRLFCLQATTGKIMYQERLGTHHSGSPVDVNGLLYFPDDDGVTHVVRAGPKFEVVAKNALGEPCFASPAVSGDSMFIRSERHLWRLRAAK